MNHVPGKHRMTAIHAGAILWLAGLLLSSQALAQPPAPPAQYYYPGMTSNPWNPQPLVQPQVQPLQPAGQPVIQPGVPPQYPPRTSLEQRLAAASNAVLRRAL